MTDDWETQTTREWLHEHNLPASLEHSLCDLVCDAIHEGERRVNERYRHAIQCARCHHCGGKVGDDWMACTDNEIRHHECAFSESITAAAE